MAAENASPLCRIARPPASRQRAASGMSPVTQTSPGPILSAIHISAASGPCPTITVSTNGCGLGRMPPFETTKTLSAWRSATRSAWSFTGQASASI